MNSESDPRQVIAALGAELAAQRPREPAALAQWFAGLQSELRQAARSQRAKLPAGETLSTTALVNEAFLKLQGNHPAQFQDARHFVAIAARAMHQVLVDAVREKTAQKRGGGEAALELDALKDHLPEADSALLMDISEALGRLDAVRPRLAEVVYLRYFAGLNDAELSAVLGVDERTVRRDWEKARGFLFEQMQSP